MGSILAVDLGTVRTGFAIADETIKVPVPLSVVDAKHTEQTLLSIIRERGVSQLVYGLPLNDDNSEGPMCAKIKRFSRRISKRAAIPFVFVDEFGSSIDAEERLGNTQKHRRVDDLAALEILTRYLDQLKTGRNG